MLPFTHHGFTADELKHPEFFVFERMSIGGTSPPVHVELEADIEDESDDFYD